MVLGPRRLVLVEGLSGSGKTTTAQDLAQHLIGQGVPATAYGEGDSDNPIAIGTLLPNLAGLIRDYAVRDDFLDDWEELASQLRSNTDTVILESRLIQDAAMFRCLAGHEDGAVSHTKSIESCVEGLRPLLIYLRVSDARAHAQRALDESSPAWVALVLRQFEKTRWFTSRGLEGAAGWVEFFAAWQPQLDAIVESLSIDVLTLQDPHDDWARTVARAREAVAASKLR